MARGGIAADGGGPALEGGAMRGSAGHRAVSGASLVLAVLGVLGVLPARADPPPFTCDGLPTDAFVADLGRNYLGLDPGSMSHDALFAAVAPEFGLGTVDCRLFSLLDSISAAGVDLSKFPSLSGLGLPERRMTVVLAVIELSGRFTPACLRVRELVFGAPKDLQATALALNAAAGAPLTNAQVLAQPFAAKNLVFELARALDKGSGLHRLGSGQTVALRCDGSDGWGMAADPPNSSPKLVSTPTTVVADPVKQLFISVRAGDRAKVKLGQGPEQKLLQVTQQARLDALSAALGDSTPPGAALVAPLPDFTSGPTLTVSGSAEPGGSVVLALGGTQVVAAVDARGAFSRALTLLPNRANTISITPYDLAWNPGPTTDVVVVHDDVPPALTAISPTDGTAEPGLTTTVSGTVIDATPVAVTVAGIEATFTGTSFTAADVPLVPGVNVLPVSATDAAGNVTTASLTVHGVPVQAGIGPGGGTVAAPAGSPLEGTALTVPAGALAAPAVVGFTLAAATPPLDESVTPVGPALRLFPAGTSFAAPVAVALPFSATARAVLHAGAPDVRVMLAEDGAAAWTEVPGPVVDFTHGMVQAEVTSFSFVQVVVRYPQDLMVSVVAGHAPGGSGVHPIGSDHTPATSTYLAEPTSVRVDGQVTTYFIEQGLPAASDFCSAVAAVATVGGCTLPGPPDWYFGCPNAQIVTDPDGTCWLAESEGTGGSCGVSRSEPALLSAPAYEFEFRSRISDFMPSCTCSAGPCGCTPVSVYVWDGQRNPGVMLLRQPGGEFVGFMDAAEPSGAAWLPLAIAEDHTYRVEVDRAGQVRYLVDGSVLHTLPYGQLPLEPTGAGTVELWAGQFATVSFHHLKFEVCAATAPVGAGTGHALRQVADGLLSTRYRPAAGRRLSGLALDGDRLVVAETQPDHNPPRTALLRLAPPAPGAPEVLADLGDLLVTGVARDLLPGRSFYYLAAQSSLDGAQPRCEILRLDPADGSLVRVAGTGTSCSASNDLIAAVPVLGTKLRLNLSNHVETVLDPAAGGGELLLIADPGNHRVLALNVSPSPVRLQGLLVQPGFALTVAGGSSFGTPGHGAPPPTLPLTQPLGLGLVGSALAITDVRGGPDLATSRSDLLVADLPFAGVTPPLSARVTRAASSYAHAAFAVDGAGAGSVRLGQSRGVAAGGAPGQEGLVVTDGTMGAVYRIWFRDQDGDGVGDSVDNCPTIANADQAPGAHGAGAACTCTVSGLPTYTRSATLALHGTCGVPGSLTITGGASDVTVPVAANGTYTASVPLRLNQRNDLVITQYDAGDHQGYRHAAAVWHDDVAPAVVITSPANGTNVTPGTLTVTGTVSDASPTTVTVDGMAATVVGSTFSASPIEIPAGPRTITATATDAAGNTRTTSIAVGGGSLSAAVVVGPGGGAVVAPAGPLAGAAIIIPPGALAGDTTVGMRLSPDATAPDPRYSPVGPALELVPAGQTFGLPVVVRMPFSPRLGAALHATARHVRVGIGQQNQPWVALTAGLVDMDAGTAEATTSHFSWVQAVVEYPRDFVVKRVAGCTDPSGCAVAGSPGTATATRLASPIHLAVSANGTVFFVETVSSRPAVRKVDPGGAISTLYSPTVAGQTIGGLTIRSDVDGPSVLLVTSSSLGQNSAILTLDEGSGYQPPPVASLGGRTMSGLAWDPINRKYLVAALPPRTPQAGGQYCVIEQYDMFGTHEGVVVGSGTCGGPGPAEYLDPSLVNLNFPSDLVASPILYGGGELLFIADTGNHRVMAYNLASYAVTVRGVTLAPRQIVTVAGQGDPQNPPPIGAPAISLGLCAPLAVSSVMSPPWDPGALLIGDNCGSGSGRSGTAILVDLVDPMYTARLAGGLAGGLAPAPADDDTVVGSVGLGFVGGAASRRMDYLAPTPACDNPDEFYIADSDENVIYRVHFNDRDGDCVGDSVDNCPDRPNPGQVDTNHDGIGDACCPQEGCATNQCGTRPDPCGGSDIACGPCTSGICGGLGVPNVCGSGATCTPRTCLEVGAECGVLSDGCDGVLRCGNNGACVAPGHVCGNDANPFLCCPPKTAADCGSNGCGDMPDGCGGVVHCGTCGDPREFCGGGGPNRCGTSSSACALLQGCGMKTCGTYSDGCRGVIDCGHCAWPATCGGDATKPEQCGCPPPQCPSGVCGWVADGCGDVQRCNNPRPCPSGLCGWYDDGCGGRFCETCPCVPESDAELCASLEKACEGDDLAQPARNKVRGDDRCGNYREITCDVCPDGERIYVAVPDPGKIVTYGTAGRLVLNHALVRVAPWLTRSDVDALAADLSSQGVGQFRVIGQIPEIRMYQFEVPATTVAELEGRLDLIEAESGRVEGVTSNIGMNSVSGCLEESDVTKLGGDARCALAQNDYQYALTVFERFRRRLKLAYVGVGVLDTGILLPADLCPEFDGIRIVPGDDASPPIGPEPGKSGHGAAVASVIASRDGNGGTNGIASKFLGSRLRLQMSGDFGFGSRYLSSHFERLGRLLRANAVVNLSVGRVWPPS